MKKIIVLGVLFVVIGLMYKYPHSMLNPGELLKGHQELNNKCLFCHNPFWGIPNDKCISCHKLSEIGKDTLILSDTNTSREKISFHQNLSNQKCISCHTDHMGLKTGRSINSFTHEILPVTTLNKCNSCHIQPTDSLHKVLTTACYNCHNTSGWKSSVEFNHDMIQGVDKTNCTSCHQKPNDNYHLLTKDNCSTCHSTSKWLPSTFNHSAYFVLDGNHNTKCNTCHTSNDFTIYTCYGCHAHSENKIREEHDEDAVNDITNCASCHKSGNKHDIKRESNSNDELKESERNNVKDYIKSQKKDKKKEHEKEDDD